MKTPSLQPGGIIDLRTALEFLASIPGQFVSTSEPVDPYCELAAVYRHVRAAVLFERVKGFSIPVVVGLLASRRRTALLMNSSVERLAFDLLDALKRSCAPVEFSGAQAPCQEVVIRPPFDLRRLLPAPTHTPLDAGPYLTLGLVRAQDPETGAADVTIHRLCLQGPDRLSIYIVPGRHIGQFLAKAERMGRALPVSINLGLDPAIHLASCFGPPGLDELSIAGGLRRRPVELVGCVSVAAQAIARAEIVLEGEILPGERTSEDALSGTGYSMPEFTGHMGQAQPGVPVVRGTAVTHPAHPIFQALIGPGEERTNLVGIPTEAGILSHVEANLPGILGNAYCHPSGGGTYLAILQIRKRSAQDEGKQREAALAALSAAPRLKQIILVDEDVNLFDSNDVLWALTSRHRGEAGNVLDCTVPYELKDRFRRPEFVKVDLARFGDLTGRDAG
jgi:4-hydroxy-3-polyprenylbenzoate decarboxylase